MSIYSLYAITDSRLHPDIPVSTQVEEAIKGGATMIQLREKNMDYDTLREIALSVKSVCRSYNVPFIINDDVVLAKEIDADGVHVGQNDMLAEKARSILGDNKLIGVTAKTVEQAVKAMEAGADYLGSGAVFGSVTKTDAVKMDKSLLYSICESVDIPVVAIGGINLDNVEELSGIPISGVAVVGGIFASDDIIDAAKAIRNKVDRFIN